MANLAHINFAELNEDEIQELVLDLTSNPPYKLRKAQAKLRRKKLSLRTSSKKVRKQRQLAIHW